MAQSSGVWTSRSDLIFEGYAALDPVTGLYTSTWTGASDPANSPVGTTFTQWYSSAGINQIRIAANYSGLSAALSSFSVEEATDFDGTSNILPFRFQSVPVTPYPGFAYVQLPITARMFQFKISGTPGDLVPITVRAI